MGDGSSRVFAVLLLLLGVWVATYWSYTPPSAAPVVTADSSVPEGVDVPRGGGSAGELADGAADGASGAAGRLAASSPTARAEAGPLSPGTDAGSTATTQTTPISPIVTGPRVLVPQFRQYTVQSGDTSWQRIAARPEVLNDAKLWQAIARSNPLVTPDRLKVGVTVLKVPLDPSNIQGVVVDGADGASETPEANVEGSAAAERTYVVERDDTLWSISRKVYGRGSEWRRIYDANRSIIKDADRPLAGATLRIPPAREASRPR
jgi:nucleoid-associated protein YgaU